MAKAGWILSEAVNFSSAGTILRCIVGPNHNYLEACVFCFITAHTTTSRELQKHLIRSLCVESADNITSATGLRSARKTSNGWRDSISHRGPDDEGYYVAGPLGLGFRRLSIIDLEGGHQPMSDQEESVWVIFNGEIYNFPELKANWKALGTSFEQNPTRRSLFTAINNGVMMCLIA